MNDLICKSIRDTRALSFTYKGAHRLVELHAYGRQSNGSDGVCAWQLGGGSGEGFRFYLVAEIRGVSLGDEFDGAREAYRRGDKRFAHIYAEL